MQNRAVFEAAWSKGVNPAL